MATRILIPCEVSLIEFHIVISVISTLSMPLALRFFLCTFCTASLSSLFMLVAISFWKAAVFCTYESFAQVSEMSKPFSDHILCNIWCACRLGVAVCICVHCLASATAIAFQSVNMWLCSSLLQNFLVLVTVVWSVQSVRIDYVQ